MAKSFVSFRKGSRVNWGRSHEGGIQPDSETQLGAILRIADATELMAQRHQELIDERDRYKKFYDNEWVRHKVSKRRIAALKGVITKLKRSRP
jgi:hypothetical protein